MKKGSLVFLACALVLMGLSGSSVKAQNLQSPPPPCMPVAAYPAGYIPFTSIYYISAPNAAGDVLLVGNMSVANFQNLSLVPVQNQPGHQPFCDTLPLTANAKYFAYVPTVTERLGTFSDFSDLLVNPQTFVPYPDGVIPATDLPGGESGLNVFAWRLTPGETVFISTYLGGQIIRVDGNIGRFRVASVGPSCGDFPGCFHPEGLAVGPDNKVYIADPSHGKISRMNQDGSQFETVFQFTGASSCNFGDASFPGITPEGPAFSSSPSGDLYFNTSYCPSGVYVIPGAGTTPFGGTFAAPINVIPACIEGACFTPGFGEGATFDNADKLVEVDVAKNSLYTLAPPYTAGTPTLLTSGLNAPTGVALNRATGQLFVNDRGPSAPAISAIAANGAASTYLVSFPGPGTSCTSTTPAVDAPNFMQFDASGHLFVVTAQDGSGGCGKVWRVDPPASAGGNPTATLLLDLQSAVSSEIVSSNRAIGLALPATQGTSQFFTLSGNGGTVTATYDGDAADITWTYPAGFVPDGALLAVTPKETTQAQWTTESGNYPGSTLATVAGSGGGGVVWEAICTFNGLPCPQQPTLDYKTVTSWSSDETNFCESSPGSPGLLKSPVGLNTWENIISACSDSRTVPDPAMGGSSCCGFSDWAAVEHVVQPAGVNQPTVTISSPTNGAIYTVNQVVDASFACNPTAGTAPVVSCAGTVANNNPIDTASPGPKTFSAVATVNTGNSGHSSVNYSVSPFQFVGFTAPVSNPPVVNIVNAGRAIPIKFQVLDGNNNPVTNLTSPPVNIQDTQVSCAALNTTIGNTVDATATGNSGFQNLGGGFYQFNWATSKAWSGTCREIQVSLGDGITHIADFQFH